MNATKETIITAKTVEEALTRACAELGAPSVEVLTYTVLDEPKRGLFGIGASPARVQVSYTPPQTSDAPADPALAFINTLLRDMQIDATAAISEPAENEKYITIDGAGAGSLIGHHGETLDALQYLTNLAVNKKRDDDKRDYVKVTIDVENYRAKREETLRALARRKAEAVLRYGRSIMLEPMNPYERRIIHSEVQLIEGVSTSSVGTDGNRKIVIYPDNRSTLARSKGDAEEEENETNEE